MKYLLNSQRSKMVLPAFFGIFLTAGTIMISNEVQSAPAISAPNSQTESSSPQTVRPYGLIPPFTNLHRMENLGLRIVKADGIYLITDKGEKLLDGTSSLFTNGSGHNVREIREAVNKQLEILDFAPLYQGMTHDVVLKLVSELQSILPADLPHMYFSNSGSEAVDTAMKLSMEIHRAYGRLNRKAFISLEGAFHGSNIGGTSLGNRTAPFLGALVPHAYKVPSFAIRNTKTPGQPQVSKEKLDELLNAMTAKIKEIHNTGVEVAAVFIEPIIGAEGMFLPPVGYLEGVREICNKFQIHLVYDEVLVGMGRSGAYWSYQAVAPTTHPDIINISKTLTNGYGAMAATAIRDSDFKKLREYNRENGGPYVSHGQTASGNPMVAAAAIAQIGMYKKLHLVERARSLEKDFQEMVFSFKDAPGVVAVRGGKGLLAAIELDKEFIGNHDLQAALIREGMFTKFTGTNIVLLAPPLVIKKEEIEQMKGIIQRALMTFKDLN